MTDTTVRADLLEALQVVTKLRVEVVRQDLERLAVDDVCVREVDEGSAFGWREDGGDG